MKINYRINEIEKENYERTLVNSYKDIVLVVYEVSLDIVYQQQHKNLDQNSCLSV